MKDWEKRNIIEEERVRELTELYESIGFQVMVKNFQPEEQSEECTECMKLNPEKYKVIYTRREK